MDLEIKNKSSTLKSINLGSSRNSVFEIILLLLVGGLFFYFLLNPKIAEVRQKRAQLKQAQEAEQNLGTKAQALTDLSEKLATNAADFKKLDEALPLNERQVRTEMLFEQVLKSSGVLISSVSVSSPTDSIAAGNVPLLKNPYGVKRSLKSLNVAIGVSGTMSQLVDMIKKLENYGRIMDISSMDMAASKDGNLDLKLNLSTYYFGAD